MTVMELRWWRALAVGANGAGAADFADGPVRDTKVCTCATHCVGRPARALLCARVVYVPNSGVRCVCAAFAAPR